MQVHIITLFLTLLIVSVLIIITFNYFKNSKSIFELSKHTIQRVGTQMEERICFLFTEFEKITKLTASLLAGKQDFSIENEHFISFILNILKETPTIYTFYVGTSNGDFVDAVNLNATLQTHYHTKNQALPDEVVFAIRMIHHGDASSQETWYYKNQHLKVLSQETFTSSFDPRTRTWYKGAAERNSEFLTPIFRFNILGERGIAFSHPYNNDNNQLMGVVSANVSLKSLSTYFEEQKIGLSGKVYLLGEQGNVLIPLNASEKLIKKPFEWFQAKGEKDFIFKQDGISYLTHIQHFPLLSKNWIVLVVVPVNDFFGTVIKTLQQTVLISIGILILSALVIIYFSKLVSKPIVKLTKEVDKIKHLDLDSETRVRSHVREIKLLDDSISATRMMLRSFGRYVPKEIVSQLMEKREEIALGGEKKVVTIFFSDIADFSSIAESYPIEEFMGLLEEYFDALSKIILDSKGTIDKYIGDSIMAIWGAPQDLKNPAAYACTAALRCQKTLQILNAERKKREKPEFYTRIGIHSGEVIVGNIGTMARMNYTVIGDAVNEASRLQQVNKIYHTSTLITEEVYKKIGTHFLCRPLDIVTVKGKQKKIKIYELVAQLDGEPNLAPSLEQNQLCTLFSEAYSTYLEGDFKKALSQFEAILKGFPNDYPTQLYVHRLSEKV